MKYNDHLPTSLPVNGGERRKGSVKTEIDVTLILTSRCMEWICYATNNPKKTAFTYFKWDNVAVYFLSQLEIQVHTCKHRGLRSTFIFFCSLFFFNIVLIRSPIHKSSSWIIIAVVYSYFLFTTSGNKKYWEIFRQLCSALNSCPLSFWIHFYQIFFYFCWCFCRLCCRCCCCRRCCRWCSMNEDGVFVIFTLSNHTRLDLDPLTRVLFKQKINTLSHALGMKERWSILSNNNTIQQIHSFQIEHTRIEMKKKKRGWFNRNRNGYFPHCFGV